MRGAALFTVFCAACLGFGTRTAQAAPYYVTVAGLGGEPDLRAAVYKALAKDLDKLFKAAGERRACLYINRKRCGRRCA